MLRLILLVGLALPVSAEVLDSSANAFVVSHTHTLAVAPARAWRVLTDDVHRWWAGGHTFSGNADHLSIKAQPQGCFCEIWSGHHVTHLTVIHSQPGRLLRMQGGLGPLQEYAVTGVLTIRLTAADDGTEMAWSYRVAGAVDGGLGAWAAPVDQVIGEQAERMARFAATGDPTP